MARQSPNGRPPPTPVRGLPPSESAGAAARGDGGSSRQRPDKHGRQPNALNPGQPVGAIEKSCSHPEWGARVGRRSQPEGRDRPRSFRGQSGRHSNGTSRTLRGSIPVSSGGMLRTCPARSSSFQAGGAAGRPGRRIAAHAGQSAQSVWKYSVGSPGKPLWHRPQCRSGTGSRLRVCSSSSSVTVGQPGRRESCGAGVCAAA